MPVVPGRHTARIEGDFVVFLIGMRINRLLQVHKWTTRCCWRCPRCSPSSNAARNWGLLHVESFLGGRDYHRPVLALVRADCTIMAHGRDLAHLPAWAAFNRRARGNTARSASSTKPTWSPQAGTKPSTSTCPDRVCCRPPSPCRCPPEATPPDNVWRKRSMDSRLARLIETISLRVIIP